MQKVGVSYRLSAKVDPTSRDSAWHSAEVTYETEVDGTVVNFEEVTEQLIAKAKTEVFAQLGVPFVEGENGELQPTFPAATDGGKTVKRTGNTDLPGVTVDGEYFLDYRNSPQKAKNPRFPDFKTPNGKKSFWLKTQDGEPTDFAKKLEEVGYL